MPYIDDKNNKNEAKIRIRWKLKGALQLTVPNEHPVKLSLDFEKFYSAIKSKLYSNHRQISNITKCKGSVTFWKLSKLSQKCQTTIRKLAFRLHFENGI